MVFFWGLVQVPSMCVWWVLFQAQFRGPETDPFFADMSQFTGSTQFCRSHILRTVNKTNSSGVWNHKPSDSSFLFCKSFFGQIWASNKLFFSLYHQRAKSERNMHVVSEFVAFVSMIHSTPRDRSQKQGLKTQELSMGLVRRKFQLALIRVTPMQALQGSNRHEDQPYQADRP